MNSNGAKAFFSTLAGLISSFLGVLFVPVLLMVTSNIVDYITGLIAAKYRSDGGISSYRSMKGIFKKVTMWLLVLVGAILDHLISYTTLQFGWEFQLQFFVAAAVAIWITCNELISILENARDIGVSIPKFLLPLVKQIKDRADNIVGNDLEESEEEKDGN